MFHAVFHFGDAMLTGTVSTTVHDTVGFHAMPKDVTSTVGTMWRKQVDGAFETVEDMRLSVSLHHETLVIEIAADLTGIQPATHKQVCEHLACTFHVGRFHIDHLLSTSVCRCLACGTAG
jgi:hypothetical protein